MKSMRGMTYLEGPRAVLGPAIALVLLSGAGCSRTGTGGGGGGATAEENLALTETMFRPDELVEVVIDMDPGDWDTLRFTSRSILDIIGGSCLDPPKRPFEYFPATVFVNGVKIENVGVRKKGFFGSLDSQKPSLKIKFDEFVEGQRFSGLSRMTLNNDKSDPAHIRQCLGYEIFAAAGVPAPRCNFARVTVNGKGLGIFTHVESIKKQFLLRYSPDNDGDLWEGALSDFRPAWVDTFQRKTNKWIDKAAGVPNEDRSQIEALVPVMQLPDAELLPALEPYLDVDRFLDFWATELLVGHLDGYARNTNNFYVYFDPPTQKMFFIPWGIDYILHPEPRLRPGAPVPPAELVWDEGVLTQRLYRHPEVGPRYLERLPTLLDAVWDEAYFLGQVDRYHDLISPEVDERKRQAFETGVAEVRTFIAERREGIEAGLAQGPPVTDDVLRDPWCSDVLGQVQATFDTTYGTLPKQDPFAAGTGTLTLAPGIDPTLPPMVRVGAKSGWDENEHVHVVEIVSWHDPNIAVILHVTVSNRARLDPSGTLALDWLTASAILYKVVLQGQADPDVTVLGIVGDGTLTFDQVGSAAGDPVVGHLDATVYESIF